MVRSARRPESWWLEEWLGEMQRKSRRGQVSQCQAPCGRCDWRLTTNFGLAAAARDMLQNWLPFAMVASFALGLCIGSFLTCPNFVGPQHVEPCQPSQTTPVNGSRIRWYSRAPTAGGLDLIGQGRRRKVSLSSLCCTKSRSACCKQFAKVTSRLKQACGRPNAGVKAWQVMSFGHRQRQWSSLSWMKCLTL
jgi:hypothetical protein